MFELLARGPLSRTELAASLAIRRNTVYDDISMLLRNRMIRATDPASVGIGRPRTPLQIDPRSRHVVGVSFQPDLIEVGRFNLLGEPADRPSSRQAPGASGESVVTTAARLMKQQMDENTAAVGVAIPGFVDRQRREIVFSVVLPSQSQVSLDPVHEAAGDLPCVIETEAHAVAARWLLTHWRAPQEDTLLIYFGDGSLGAAFIVHGRPNPGCISGANELGHTRLHVQTRRCYCGGVGCLERLCDSQDLQAHGLPVGFADALAGPWLDHPAMGRMTDLLAIGFANAVTFTRAAHVIIASNLAASEQLIERLIDRTRGQLQPQLQQRVRFDLWPNANARSARTAAHLAMTNLYFERW